MKEMAKEVAHVSWHHLEAVWWQSEGVYITRMLTQNFQHLWYMMRSPSWILGSPHKLLEQAILLYELTSTLHLDPKRERLSSHCKKMTQVMQIQVAEHMTEDCGKWSNDDSLPKSKLQMPKQTTIKKRSRKKTWNVVGEKTKYDFEIIWGSCKQMYLDASGIWSMFDTHLRQVSVEKHEIKLISSIFHALPCPP